MKRRRDWAERLAAIVDARRHVPFAWGTNDCALWIADVVLEMTGHDLGAAHRGTYDDERGALRHIHAAGGLRELLAELPEKPVGLAQRGDVVIAVLDGRDTFGVVVGGGWWCAPGPDGLVFRPVSEVVTALGV
jgi:hypothetical protein